MTNALRMGRQAFTIGVVGATIAWSIGLAALVAPLRGTAAMAGDRIKGSLPAVYYYGADGRRYVFPNEKTYKSWYSDFSGVVTMSDAEVAAIAIGGNVVYRGGTRLLKIQSDPKVYAIEPGGKIRWVESEAVASGLYGSSWAGRVDDVPDVFFSDYTPAASLSSATSYPDGTLVMATGATQVYLISGGQKRAVSAAAMTANGYRSDWVVTTAQNLAAYADGAALAAAESALTDASQNGGTGAAPGAAPTGGLTVSLASDTPAGSTVPRGATGVSVLAFELAASGGAATVSSIVAKRFGPGASADLPNVYLYADGARLTDARPINATTNEVTFSGLNLALADGAKKKLWLKADVLATAGSAVHGFQIEAATKVAAGSATVSGSFPVSGNQLSVAQATVGTILMDASGTISNPTLGQMQAEIARFTLNTTDEVASITNMTFTLEGSIRGADLKNFKLKQSGTTLAEAAAVSGRDLIVFNLSPAYSLPEGATRVFSVYADVSGDATRTIGIRLAETADLANTGGDFGFGMRVTNAGYNGGAGDGAASGACAAATDDCSFSTTQGSTLTLAFNGPAATDVGVNSQDKELMNFSMTAQQQVTVKDLQVTLTCAAGTDCDNDANDNGGLIRQATEANLKDVKISKADGTLLMGPLELTLTGSDAAQTLAYTEDFTMATGETLSLKITADVDNDAPGGESYTATVLVASLTTAVDINNDALAANQIIPSANMAGNQMTTRAAGVTVTFSQPPSDGLAQAHVRGSTNQPTVGYSLAAAQGSDVTVTAITYNVSVDGDMTTDQTDFIALSATVTTDTEAADGGVQIAGRDMISSASLYDGDTGALVDGPESLRTDGTVVFDNFVWMVTKGTTKKLVVRTNIANYTVANEPDGYALRINAAASVTARDADGNNATVTLGANNGTATSPTVFMRVTDSGTLAVARAANSPRSDLLLMGATDVPVARFTITSTDEAFRITEVTAIERASTANGGTIGDNDNNVTSLKLQYPKQDGSTGNSVAFLTAAEAEFAGLEMYVAANTSATFSVLATLASHPGATSGEKAELDFDIDAAADDQFRAVGLSSGVTLDDDNVADAAAFQHVVRRTQPTLALAQGSPTTGVPGLAETFRFTVAAAAGQAVVLDIITFKMTSTDNNADSGTAGIADEWNVCDDTADDEPQQQITRTAFTLFDAAASNTALEAGDADWFLLTAAGAACGASSILAGVTGTDDASRLGFARLNLTTSEVVAAGTTKTYQLKVDTTGAAAANDDSVRFEIVNEPIVTQTSFLAASTFGAVPTAIATTVAVADGTLYAVGDLICLSTTAGACAATAEVGLVTTIATNNLTVYRGDLGTVPTATDLTIGDHVRRMPASLYWDDDGLVPITAATSASGYLVDGLDVSSATIVY